MTWVLGTSAVVTLATRIPAMRSGLKLVSPSRPTPQTSSRSDSRVRDQSRVTLYGAPTGLVALAPTPSGVPSADRAATRIWPRLDGSPGSTQTRAPSASLRGTAVGEEAIRVTGPSSGEVVAARDGGVAAGAMTWARGVAPQATPPSPHATTAATAPRAAR